MATSNNMQTPVGTATGEFNANGQIVKDTALLDLVNKVQMYYGGADLSVTSPNSAGKIPKGTVTIGDISTVYIYPNYLFTVTVTGAQLRKYLEFSVCKYYKTYISGDISISKYRNSADYNLDILQGADYVVDLTKSGLFDSNGKPVPGGQPRITKLAYNGNEVKNDQVFKLAMNSYRFNGGGGFLAAVGIKPQRKDPEAANYIVFDSQKVLGDAGQIPNLLAKYFQEMAVGKIIPGKTEVEPICDNNWKLIPRVYEFMHLSDIHGNIDNGRGALMAGAVNNERSIYGDECTLLLSAGDMYQGTAISNILKGKPVIDIMNQMRFDAMSPGNHEFDWGLGVLNNNTLSAKFPSLAANLLIKKGNTDKGSNEFIKNIKTWIILDKNDLKVGIIGIVNTDMTNTVSPSIMNHFTIEDPATTINKLVPQIKSAGADVVVVLAHIGDEYNDWPTTGPQPERAPLSQDLADLVKEIKGVSAIFGGNSHTINYDLVPDGEGTLIPAVVGNDYGIAIVRLVFGENNELLNTIPGYLDIYNRLSSSIVPDSATETLVNTANQEAGAVLNKVIGKAEVDMTRYTSDDVNLDSNLGDWATDVLRAVVKADFAFINLGCLRTNIYEGEITVGKMWTLMPFDDDINILDMTGEQVKKIVEYMVSGIKNIGYISGLRFTYDKSKPPRFSLATNGTLVENSANNRIMWITLSDGTPINFNKTYKVAAPDFVAFGGDYYPFPTNSTNLISTGILVRDALINNVSTSKTLHYVSDGRIQTPTFSTYQFIRPNLDNIIANEQVTKEFGIKSVSVGNTGYLNARINIAIEKPEGAIVEMQYFDSAGNQYIDAVALGFLWPENGMPIMPEFNHSENLKLKFSKGGVYTIKYVLTDLNTGTDIAVDSSTFSVKNPEPVINANLKTKAVKGEKINFIINIKANNNTSKDVMLRITFVDEDGKAKLKLNYTDFSKKDKDVKFNKTGTALFGSPNGFPLADDSIPFELKLDKEGIYRYNFEIIELNNYSVLASKTGTVTVLKKR